MSKGDPEQRAETEARREPMTDADRARLAASLQSSRRLRQVMVMGGVICIGLGLAVGAVLAVFGDRFGAVLFPLLLGCTGGLFVWLGARVGSVLRRDLEAGEVTVLEGIVEGKREMRVPHGTTYLFRVDGQDVFVGSATFARCEKGVRVRIRRSPHASVALGVEQLGPDDAPLVDD